MADYYKPVSVGARRAGQTDQRYATLPDGSVAPVMVAVGADGSAIGGGSGGTERVAITLFYFYNESSGSLGTYGDTITATQIIDVTTDTPTTIATIWRNQTTGTDLAAAPPAQSIRLISAGNYINQTGQLNELETIKYGVGYAGDNASTVDAQTGLINPSSIIGLVKRALMNWTTLLDRIPVLIGNAVPVRALLAAGAARSLTTTNTSASTALSSGIRAVSIFARNADARLQIGNGAQTATATSSYIASGERLDFDVSLYAAPQIAVIFGPGAAAATLELTELY